MDSAAPLKLSAELSFFLNSLPVMTWLSGPDRNRQMANAMLLQFTGVTDGSLASMDRLVHPDDLARICSVFDQAYKMRQAYQISYQLTYNDGSYRRVNEHGVPYHGLNGEFIGFLGSVTDLTQWDEAAVRKQQMSDQVTSSLMHDGEQQLAATTEELSAAHEELMASNDELLQAQEALEKVNAGLEATIAQRTAELQKSQAHTMALNADLSAINKELHAVNAGLEFSEHRTRAIVDNAPFPIAVYAGREMRIILANQALRDVWGKGDDVIGKTYYQVLPELEEQGIFPRLDAVFTSGEPYHASHQRVDLVMHGVPRTFYFNYSFTPLRDKSGEIYGVMNTAADVSDLVFAKQKVEQSEKDLHGMILQAPVAMCLMIGEDHVVEIANELMIQLWGKPVEQVMYKPIFEGLPDARNQGLEEAMAGVYRTGEEYRAVEQPVNLLRNGKEEVIFQNFVYSPYKDFDGNIIGVVATTIDVTSQVTARKLLEKSYEDQQEVSEELAASNEELAAVNEELTAINEELITTQESLLRSEKLFKSIAINIPGSLVLVFDTDQRFIAIEGDLMQKLNYDSAHFVGKTPKEVMPPDRYQASKDLYDRVLAGEHFTVERKSADNEDFIVHLVPLKDEEGVVYAGLLIALDITRIKRAEIESARLAAIVHSSNDAIVSKTLDGIITSWNKSAERIFGYEENEMIGESIMKLIPEDRAEEEPRIISRIRKGERVEHFETIRRAKSGKLFDVSLSISPVTDAAGNIVGVSKIARDISEKKQEENRKNDFIGMVSHELKTPLTSLTALIQVVQMKLDKSNDSFLAGALEKANTQARKMAVMINGFLNVSRLESGKLLIEKSEIELRNIIDDVIAETELTSSTHNIEFLPGDPLILQGDPDKIASVVSNLVANAIKYSPRGTDIRIECIRRDGLVQVCVTDKGIGIAEQDRDRLFERYYRVENGQTRHISGFGIGLYVSAEIVKRHGGEIWVESELGKGATFCFTLPLN